MFNHTLGLVVAPHLRVTDVHLNIYFQQVNISIPWPAWTPPPTPPPAWGCLHLLLIYSPRTPQPHLKCSFAP